MTYRNTRLVHIISLRHPSDGPSAIRTMKRANRHGTIVSNRPLKVTENLSPPLALARALSGAFRERYATEMGRGRDLERPIGFDPTVARKEGNEIPSSSLPPKRSFDEESRNPGYTRTAWYLSVNKALARLERPEYFIEP